VPDIQPFPGLLYRVPSEELARVLAPPYDVISPAGQDELYARDPRNIVRVALNRTPGDAAYEDAARHFAAWKEQGLIAADPAPALYLLEQTFGVEGRTLRRYGLLARFRAEDYAKGVVLPHEHTRAAAKEDRWKLLKATRANFSPIFLMFPDPGSRFSALAATVIGQPATLAYTDDGHVQHRLWRVESPEPIAAFQALIGGQKAYIADGHHRYATALRYRDEKGPEGAWTFGYFTPMGAPGLLVQPYHRILSEGPSAVEARARLAPHFTLTPCEGVLQTAAAVANSRRPWAFALAWPGGEALLAESLPSAETLLPGDVPPSLRVLDTYFLHRGVLGSLLGVPEAAVSYVHSLGEAEAAVGAGRAALAVLLRGTPVEQIVDVSHAGESMPAKSTFFHPKLPSGLVIHPLLT
jgi:uncharacterized protein (DUF1015 family)